MPTILTHAVVPLALAVGLGNRISRRLLIAGIVAAILPDLDVVAFRLHIAYADAFGHRGASHSLLFALAVGLLALFFSSQLRSSPRGAFVFAGVAAASHGLLDMLTNGGLGVALYWPWSVERFFAPWQVIEVSPLALSRVFGARGLVVLQSELLWVWLPAAILAGALLAARKLGARFAAEKT
ncbi:MULTISPECIES: metal-dependent hydrolase [unclassified Janthinobacterium]|uniref:metal-dependent hydrolase n=1 Tax=unclassified Janthinobacterium TaxID=2610881 RepID=UPI0004767B56|nr:MULTISPECIES: metal-dependent hydrolase [unclassified Janthinobacterium]MEC5161268.1 inner membrane protein [Janthinobacterium sp. CG_S6]